MPVSGQRDSLLGRVALWLAAASVAAVAATMLVLALPALSQRLGVEGTIVAYAEGGFIDLDPSTFASTPRTLFLFSRFSCGACQASKPVMAALVVDLALRPDVQIVLVTDDAVPEEERVFARELGIDASHIHRTDLRRLRLRRVPTIVLADDTGKILMTREGRLTESDRHDVIRLSGPPAER
jgi:hypothetical protein